MNYGSFLAKYIDAVKWPRKFANFMPFSTVAIAEFPGSGDGKQRVSGRRDRGGCCGGCG